MSTLNEISMCLPLYEKLNTIASYHYSSKSKVIFVSSKARMHFHTCFGNSYEHSVHIFCITGVDDKNSSFAGFLIHLLELFHVHS